MFAQVSSTLITVILSSQLLFLSFVVRVGNFMIMSRLKYLELRNQQKAAKMYIHCVRKKSPQFSLGNFNKFKLIF